MRFDISDSNISRLKKLIRGTPIKTRRAGSPLDSRPPVVIGIHEFHYQHRAGSRGKVLLGRFVCSHCGEERLFGVSWDSGFNNYQGKE